MMNFTKKLFMMSLALCSLIAFSSCDDDVDMVDVLPTGDFKTYNLLAKNNSGVSGTVKFEKLSNSSTLATIQLTGTSAGNMHPAHIHKNTALQMGAIAITFNPIDGATGKSVTTITSFDDQKTATYEDIIGYNGYVNVHLSATDLTVVSQVDIGINELTGKSKSYNLQARNSSGVSGTVKFEERKSGTTLATIDVNGTNSSLRAYPAHIHKNSALETGAIAITFNSVDSASGKSMTNITKLDDGAAITYTTLLGYDGYVNVHRASDLGVVSQADIGGNELTTTSITYDLPTKDVPGVSAVVKFEKRKNGNALATITVTSTGPLTADAPAHIHAGSVANAPGDIKFTFTPVNMTTKMSMTHVEKLDGEDSNSFGYDKIIAYDGYVNVHQSMANLATILAQGNIGSND